MIDVDKILKAMRVDPPAHLDKRILALELRKAENWFHTRSKLDKWLKREKIISCFITDTKRYRAALKVYSEARGDIPLPFMLPCWLNTEALDAVIIEAELWMRALHQNQANEQAIPKIYVELGVDKGSPMDFLLGSMLPKVFLKCFKFPLTVWDKVRSPDTPFVRFAVEAARQIAAKTAPSPQSVASSYRTMNTPGAGRRRALKPTVQR